MRLPIDAINARQAIELIIWRDLFDPSFGDLTGEPCFAKRSNNRFIPQPVKEGYHGNSAKCV